MPNSVTTSRPSAAQQGADAPRADVVIVNWNAGVQLADCLRSVAEFGEGAVGRVFVVDNGSTDGSADVSVAGLDLEIIRTGENLGFGPACNLAARRATAPYILFLNPDAELRAGVLARVLAHLEQPENAGAGAAGVRLVGRDGVAHRHCARFPTWRSFVGNSIGLARISRGFFPPIPLLEFDHLESRPVDHVMGAFYCVRRAVFEAVGGFDEAFFVYLEDLDLSRRIAAAGWRIDYLADVAAYHKQGGTSDQVKAHRLFYALESNIVYAFKHRPRGEALLVAGVTLAVEPFSRLARAALHGSGDDFAATARGFGMLYRALPRVARRVRLATGAKAA